MPSISHKRLHTRDYMSRVLVRAGQFAHLERQEIDLCLASIYSQRARAKANNRDIHADELQQAAPEIIVKLYRSGATPQMFDADGTLQYFVSRLGEVCPLCRTVEASRWRRRLPRGLTLFVSPSFLFTIGDDEDGSWRKTSVCERCVGAMSFKDGSDMIERKEYAAVLARLITNSGFRQRVKHSKFRRLRFDPRRAPSIIERREAA